MTDDGKGKEAWFVTTPLFKPVMVILAILGGIATWVLLVNLMVLISPMLILAGFYLNLLVVFPVSSFYYYRLLKRLFGKKD